VTNLVALIPARAGSKRIPDKNIRPLGGLPLLAWSILSAIDLGVPCYCSSDSQHYLDLAASYGALPIIRPPELATDTATDFDVIKHACSYFQGHVLYLRPTTPFRALHVLKQAVNLWLNSGDQITGLRSVEELPESIDKCFYVKGGLLVPIQGTLADTDVPNQQHRACYKGNGYCDFARHAFTWPSYWKTPWGDIGGAYITPSIVELDTADQWDYAEYVMRRDSIAARYQKFT